MKLITYKFIHLTLVVLFTCVTLTSCGRNNSEKEGKAVAYVNKEPILEKELARTLEIKKRQNPDMPLTQEAQEEQLDLIIDKKLIIQEAIEQGLIHEERFVDTIKTYWEQTLVRDFIQYKKEEFKNKLSVSDAEIKQYYDYLGKRKTFKILESRDKRYIQKTYENLVKKKEVADVPWATVGPVRYNEIDSPVLLGAVDLSVGGFKIIDKDQKYYLVTVADSEDVTLDSLAALRSKIENEIMIQKERKLFDDWMSRKRKEAKIKILKK